MNRNDIEPRIRESFDRQRLLQTLGARLGRVADGEVEILLAASPHISQQHGFVHAGALAAIADSACGYACLTRMPEDSGVLSVEFKINAANTNEAARCAIYSLQGHFSTKINALIDLLITLRMLIEATLDFPEEEIDNVQALQIKERLDHIHTQIERIFASARQGSLLQEGIRIVLAGAPNVGKSSLLNQLVEDDAAIVTEIPGTTRDTIQRTIAIEGIPIHINDTAGLRQTNDIVEEKGIERTHAAIQNANMVIWLIDSSQQQSENKDQILTYIPAGSG